MYTTIFQNLITKFLLYKTLIISITIACVVFAVSGYFMHRFMPFDRKFITYTVIKGTFVEDVLASGKVEGATTASFNFKNQGRITAVNVASGDIVKAGQELVLQDTSSFDSQLAEMDAGIQLQRARINQLKAGSSQEEIDVVSASASSASVVLSNAETNLNISKQQAVDQIKNAYTVADDVIRNKIDRLFTNPQSSNPKLLVSSASDFQLGNDLEFARVALEKELKAWNTDIAGLTANSDLTSQLAKTRTRLSLVKQFVDKCSLFVNNSNNTPSSLGQSIWEGLKVDVASGRLNINTALSTVTAAEASITQSQSLIDNANSSVKTANKKLQQTKASVRGTDLAVYRAQLEQAVAAKRKIEAQRSDLVIVAPFSGMVTEVNAKKGEVVGPQKDLVSLLSYDKLQIKVNVVENNIIKITVGQNARITFDAIPSKEYSGKILSIDPAEKEINGTTYYQTTIEVNETIDFLRSGMTANVWILTKESPNSLYVPISALFKNGDTWKVRVMNGKLVDEKDIVTGAKDRNGMIQILSGIIEGDTVILDDTNSYDVK